MDIKEIRVGCYYYFNHPQIEKKNQIVMMTEKLLFAMFGDPLNYGLQFYSPILLSEEILLKAGFVKTNRKEIHLYKDNINWHESIPDAIIIELDNGSVNYDLEIPCESLHHLQNICFDLGQELEIKL